MSGSCTGHGQEFAACQSRICCDASDVCTVVQRDNACCMTCAQQQRSATHFHIVQVVSRTRFSIVFNTIPFMLSILVSELQSALYLTESLSCIAYLVVNSIFICAHAFFHMAYLVRKVILSNVPDTCSFMHCLSCLQHCTQHSTLHVQHAGS